MKPGRPLVSEAARLRIFNIRLTRDQIEKLGKLGGAAWIRASIDKARVSIQKDKP